MTAFSGTLAIQIDADTNDEASRALDGIAKLASGFPCVEVVVVSTIEKSTIRKPREEVRHA